MTDVTARYISDSVLIIDLGNMRPQELVRHAYRLSRSTQEQFASLMGIHRVTLARYLSGAVKPSQVVACAAVFAAICCGVSMRVPRVKPLSVTTSRTGRRYGSTG
jgi:transcriptional regulator with XRE-family HTH domain